MPFSQGEHLVRDVLLRALGELVPGQDAHQWRVVDEPLILPHAPLEVCVLLRVENCELKRMSWGGETGVVPLRALNAQGKTHSHGRSQEGSLLDNGPKERLSRSMPRCLSLSGDVSTLGKSHIHALQPLEDGLPS